MWTLQSFVQPSKNPLHVNLAIKNYTTLAVLCYHKTMHSCTTNYRASPHQREVAIHVDTIVICPAAGQAKESCHQILLCTGRVVMFIILKTMHSNTVKTLYTDYNVVCSYQK